MIEDKRVKFIETLLEKREIYLDEEIEENSAERIIKLIMFLNARDEKKKITLFINSNGGDMKDSLRVYNFIKYLSSACVEGIVIGTADSMALVVLQACQKRSALKTSSFFLHNLNLHIYKEWNEFENLARQKLEEIKKQQEEVFKILGEKGDIKKIKELSYKKTELNVYQAKELGLIDEII